jgi:dTDP-3-amino-3,4,6-trideoxy-alpha-D-glucose transaminase
VENYVGTAVVPEGAKPAWHLYVVTHPRADELLAALTTAGVQARGYYRQPLHRQPAMAPYVADLGSLPATDALAAGNIALPISPVFTEQQAQEVVAAIAGAA